MEQVFQAWCDHGDEAWELDFDNGERKSEWWEFDDLTVSWSDRSKAWRRFVFSDGSHARYEQSHIDGRMFWIPHTPVVWLDGEEPLHGPVEILNFFEYLFS